MVKGLRNAVLAVAAACTGAGAGAAELPAGRWTGTMVPPGGDGMEVALSFSEMAGRPLATLSLPDARMVGLSNIVVSDTALSFGYFLDGVSVKCELTLRDDGSYAGPCVDGDGTEGALRMSPIE